MKGSFSDALYFCFFYLKLIFNFGPGLALFIHPVKLTSKIKLKLIYIFN